MNEFTVRIICDHTDPEALKKCDELIKFLTADGWFRVFRGSGEETVDVKDSIVVGFNEESKMSARICNQLVQEKDPEYLSVRLHRIFFDKRIIELTRSLGKGKEKK